MKLHSITLENFRVFKKPTTFEFQPLTVLTGPNSSGKSTVVKALMLLQENLKKPDYLGRLTFKDGKHRLGNFQSIVNKDRPNDGIGFTLKYYVGDYNDSILNNIDFIILRFKYYQDKIQSENGLLHQFQIWFSHKDNIVSTNIFNFWLQEKCKIDINLEWIIKEIISQKLINPSPLMHRIHEQKLVDNRDFNEHLNEEKSKISAELKEKLDSLNDNLDNIKNEQFQNERNILQKKIDEIKTDINWDKNDYQKEIEKLINEKNYLNEALPNSQDEEAYRDLEQELIRVEQEIKRLEILQAEDPLKKKMESLKEELEKLESNYVKSLNAHYQSQLKTFEKDSVKTKLFNQLKEGCTRELDILVNLSFRKDIEENEDYKRNYENIQFEDELLLDERNLTITDYLFKKVNKRSDDTFDELWKAKIEGIFTMIESVPIENIIPWTNNHINFIKPILHRFTENGDGLTFGDIFKKGGENAITKEVIKQISFILNTTFSEIAFVPIGAVRGLQRRLYKISNGNFSLEDSLSLLLSMQYRNEVRKLDYLNKWLADFNIGEKIEAKVVEGSFVQGYIDNINIADKGLGIAQLIPILINVANVIPEKIEDKANEVICIEEPGTHLHPDLQAQLVDFTKDAIDQGISFVFETHSEYFIRKLQYAVAKENTLTPDKVSIYYINKGEKKSITINQAGDLSDNFEETYGKEFLGQSTLWITLRKARKQILKGFKSIACEGKNDVAFNSLNLGDCKFYGKNNSTDVYRTVKMDNKIIGLRDRDFLLNEEISLLCSNYSNYKVLKFYSYESYLYHPENLVEFTQKYLNVDFDKGKYIKHLTQEKNNISREELFSDIRAARDSYTDLMTEDEKFRKNRKDERKERVRIIFRKLNSDDIDEFYPFFNIKKIGKKYICETYKYQYNEADFYSTNWFRQQIAGILDIDL